jgi:hypothetical protein
VKFQINLENNDETIPNILKAFYDNLDPEKANERLIHFWEMVGKVKGTNHMSDQGVDFIMEEILWAAMYYVKTHENGVTIVPIVEEEKPEVPTAEKISKPKEFDPSVG